VFERCFENSLATDTTCRNVFVYFSFCTGGACVCPSVWAPKCSLPQTGFPTFDSGRERPASRQRLAKSRQRLAQIAQRPSEATVQQRNRGARNLALPVGGIEPYLRAVLSFGGSWRPEEEEEKAGEQRAHNNGGPIVVGPPDGCEHAPWLSCGRAESRERRVQSAESAVALCTTRAQWSSALCAE